ncbi:MAG TPA: cysteine protease [Rhodocyclaceae bacterium]|nr:MAG: cysteine protease [Betaproteobacteria bacterium CG2_30_68_42]PIV74672.1 MAG: cysteine protease [Rhodocyclales bacterium CG17_big_fil_post_rev_8_21_14_2_50_68_7]PIX76342.1 MAG: cysteine protease [Rhodocyclales bacterium CG_4_10_14_3_um_filter_68_10]PJA57677.1 MAG: cysteine protease [Rhodocyclales bacterium CG_4_9_14_3_um_filter_68_10]HCX32126.1 cysteine protease [Rhodocyclaceae bacterium]
MIFQNPGGAPELACEQCGCRWFDRMTNTCYECGAEVPAEAVAEFLEALARFNERHPGAEGGQES